MAKIYRYIDMRDNFIKYVGIVYGENRTLEQRHKEHLKKDIWCDENFKVQYLDVPINSRSEAEALEAHFISLYQTGSWYNKSKSNWGQSSFVPKFNERDWQNFYYSLTQQDLENINNKRNHLINKNIDNYSINNENIKYIIDRLDSFINFGNDLTETYKILVNNEGLEVQTLKTISENIESLVDNEKLISNKIICFYENIETLNKIFGDLSNNYKLLYGKITDIDTKNQKRWKWIFILLFLILFIILIKK